MPCCSSVSFFFLPHSPAVQSTQPFCWDDLCLLFQFKTQFSGWDGPFVSGYKSPQRVREIEFPMNMWWPGTRSPLCIAANPLPRWCVSAGPGLASTAARAGAHTHTHTYVMTWLWGMAPQGATITRSQQVCSSCRSVWDFMACWAHMSLRLQPAGSMCVFTLLSALTAPQRCIDTALGSSCGDPTANRRYHVRHQHWR